jgi:hypothetical protein
MDRLFIEPRVPTLNGGRRWAGGIAEVDIRGGRQHYLRFEVPTTWRFWDGAGLSYDSTLMFADHAGFRCGTCYEFSVFDLHRREHLKLKEVPTIVMDSTVTSERYMGLGVGSGAYEFVSELRERCRLFDGNFTLLWHNNLLSDAESKEFYRSILR